VEIPALGRTERWFFGAPSIVIRVAALRAVPGAPGTCAGRNLSMRIVFVRLVDSIMPLRSALAQFYPFKLGRMHARGLAAACAKKGPCRGQQCADKGIKVAMVFLLSSFSKSMFVC
jgi:hypothetical protein